MAVAMRGRRRRSILTFVVTFQPVSLVAAQANPKRVEILLNSLADLKTKAKLPQNGIRHAITNLNHRDGHDR
jgi:hypothetical protein